jgi:hypothetical protein
MQTKANGKKSFGLESVFRQYKVDVVLNGHKHCYERFHPVYNVPHPSFPPSLLL